MQPRQSWCRGSFSVLEEVLLLLLVHCTFIYIENTDCVNKGQLGRTAEKWLRDTEERATQVKTAHYDKRNDDDDDDDDDDFKQNNLQ